MPEQLGLSCALSTPFGQDARVDTARLAEHAKWCLAQGCDSITLFGTTGEGAAVGVKDRAQSIKALLAGIAPARLLSGITACAPDDAVAPSAPATRNVSRRVGRLLGSVMRYSPRLVFVCALTCQC